MPGNIDPSPGGCLSPADKQQSQSVNPRCEAPDLDPSSGGFPMRLASSKREREAIFRLRYDVLVEELDGGAGHPEADAASRTLRDEWDENAHHFYVVRDGAVVASARVNLSRDGNVELEDLIEIRRFTPFYPNSTSFVSRLVVHPAFRGTHLMGKSSETSTDFIASKASRLCSLTADPVFCRFIRNWECELTRPGSAIQSTSGLSQWSLL